MAVALLTARVCAVALCERRHHANGYCAMHAARVRRTGSPETRPVRRRDPLERLLAKVDKTASCWLWTAATDGRGYGAAWFEGRVTKAHRAVWTCIVGPIPDGLELDHLCRTPLCVRPDHLEPVTHAENVSRGEAGAWVAAKTACIHGHEYTPETTFIDSKGARACRTCRREQRRARRANRAGRLAS